MLPQGVLKAHAHVDAHAHTERTREKRERELLMSSPPQMRCTAPLSLSLLRSSQNPTTKIPGGKKKTEKSSLSARVN